MFLDFNELCELTGRRRHSSQSRALVLMGIEHKTRPDGSLAVLKSHVEKILGGSTMPVQRKTSPRFDLVA